MPRTKAALTGPSFFFSPPRLRLIANAALRANIWFNYVASKANVADLPSRGALDEMAGILASFLPSFSLRDDRRPLRLPGAPVALADMWAAITALIEGGAGSVSVPAPKRHARGGRPHGKRQRV